MAGQAGHHVVAGIAGEPVSPEVTPPRKAPPVGPPPAIPRIVHQTFKAKDLIKSVDRARMQTWKALNPTWTIMLWDDRACTTFVQTEYPELYPAYAGLAKNVERADFFRYLVVYHYGGLYADTDVTCLQPLDVWLPPSAELVVGLENEFPSAELAGSRQYACARQYLQWAFLARKNAPLLKAAVDRILHPESALPEEGSKARKADLTTLELTGPGMWTQEIFKYVGALMDDGSSLDSVLLLPRVSMGLFPKNFQGVDTDHPGGLLLHNFEGSWKKKSWYLTRYLKRRAYASGLIQKPQVLAQEVPREAMPVALHIRANIWVNVFSRHMQDLGREYGQDMSATLSNLGAWQAGMPTIVRPSLLDVVLGALGGGHKTEPGGGAGGSPSLGFSDFAAGNGLYSVAAAAATQAFVRAVTSPPNRNCELLDLAKNTSTLLGSLEVHCQAMTTPMAQAEKLAVGLFGTSPGGKGRRAGVEQWVARFGGAFGLATLLELLGGEQPKGSISWVRVPVVTAELSGAGLLDLDGAQAALTKLPDLGMVHIYHAGRLCLDRFVGATQPGCGELCVPRAYSDDPLGWPLEQKKLQRKNWGGYKRDDRPPGWCYLSAGDNEGVKSLLEDATSLDTDVAEVIVFSREPLQAFEQRAFSPEGFLLPAQGGDALH